MSLKWTNLFLLVLIFLISCSNSETKDNHSTVYHDEEIKSYEVFATKAKDILQAKDSVTTIETLASEGNLLIGFKVKSLQSLKLKSIKKDFTKQLTKEFPMHHIFLSTDQKVIIEMRRLAAKREQLTAVEYASALQKIIALEQEET